MRDTAGTAVLVGSVLMTGFFYAKREPDPPGSDDGDGDGEDVDV